MGLPPIICYACVNVFSDISIEIWTDLTNSELKTVSSVNESSTMYRVHSPKACNCRWPIVLFKILAQNQK